MSTTLPHMVWPYANLECRSEMYCARLAENTGRKIIATKFAIWAPAHNFVGLYLHNYKACIDNRKKLVKQQYLLQTPSQYRELRPL